MQQLDLIFEKKKKRVLSYTTLVFRVFVKRPLLYSNYYKDPVSLLWSVKKPLGLLFLLKSSFHKRPWHLILGCVCAYVSCRKKERWHQPLPRLVWCSTVARILSLWDFCGVIEFVFFHSSKYLDFSPPRALHKHSLKGGNFTYECIRTHMHCHSGCPEI